MWQQRFCVADIQGPLPNIMPVEMIFAGPTFEYVDLRAAMRNLRQLCAPAGTLVAVMQAPSAHAKACRHRRIEFYNDSHQ